MNISEQLDRIPRGNTCPGVNRTIIEVLLDLEPDLANERVLDVPCGRGEFLDVLKTFFPASKTFGADVNPPTNVSEHQFLQADLTKEFEVSSGLRFRLVTCISGVMEFDNTLGFFREVRKQIDDQGLFIVTNDNLVSVRDRILYFFAGRFRQYPLYIGHDHPTWKILTLQNLLRILRDADFSACEIRYVPPKWSEWLWLPIALPLYLFQVLSFQFGSPETGRKEKAMQYPFASLISRHYMVVCRPMSGPADQDI
jgi:SAM-dependent methyltransferase